MPKHPIGSDHDPTTDPHTAANRDALLACLTLYFENALADQMTARDTGESLIGLPLAHRFVSRLEIGHALKRLRLERPDLYLPLWLHLKQGWTREQTAQRLHLDPKTLRRRLTDGLDYLIDAIWR